jgi:hypothetical protein
MQYFPIGIFVAKFHHWQIIFKNNFMLNLSFKRLPKIYIKKKNHHISMHCLSK